MAKEKTQAGKGADDGMTNNQRERAKPKRRRDEQNGACGAIGASLGCRKGTGSGRATQPTHACAHHSMKAKITSGI